MLTSFQISFIGRFSSKFAVKQSLISHRMIRIFNVSLHYLVKRECRKTNDNLTRASLSTINRKVLLIFLLLGYCTPERGANYCDQLVCKNLCLSVGLHISKTACPNFKKFSVHVTCGLRSVLLWRQCIECNTIYTSGFVDDVVFSHNGAYVV